MLDDRQHVEVTTILRALIYDRGNVLAYEAALTLGRAWLRDNMPTGDVYHNATEITRQMHEAENDAGS